MQLQTTARWSAPKILLHVEGAIALAAAVIAYGNLGYSWLAFGLLLLTPDASALGYLISVRVGTATYNLVHTYLLPAALVGVSLLMGWAVGLQLGLIWLAHIGMDRLFGYGIKYPTEFKDTHLSRV